MKITKTQYQYLDKIQHLWRDINSSNAHIELICVVDNGDNTEAIFYQLPELTKALINAEQQSDESLLEIE